MPLNLVQSLDGHTDRVWTLAWNPAGTILASSGGDKSIRLWAKTASESWNCASILTETHSKSIRRLSWSPCGQYLASASFDATVCIWKQDQQDKSWVTVVNLEGHENEVKSVAWSHDGRYLASCGRDRTVWIWERATADQDEVAEDDSVENWDCSDVKNDHSKDVKHIVWHPCHNILVSCSYDDTVKFFSKEGEDWKCFDTLTSHSSTVWSADFSASGEYLSTCSDDKTVRIWKNHSHNKLPNVESQSWKCVSVIQGYHSRTIYDVSWCKSKDIVASASGDNSIAIYGQIESSTDSVFTCITKLSHSHNCDVNSLSWNPKESDLIASGSDDSSIKIWKYTPDDKGTTKPKKIFDEILTNLTDSSLRDNSLSNDGKSKPLDLSYEHKFKMKITDFPNLFNSIQQFQLLQNELYMDSENFYEDRRIEKLFNLKVIDNNSQPVELSELKIDEQDKLVEEFSIHIKDKCETHNHEFRIILDREKFRLNLPRRSYKFLIAANQLFVIDKTGDLYKLTPSGDSHFLLGHLFMFSDVKFVLDKEKKKIVYIISADRDEKIRITNYPEVWKIERFCFGHKSYITRILVSDDHKFVSIDEQNKVNLWNLEDLKNPSKPLRTLNEQSLSK